ncbi:CHAT domain-containing protein [Xanthomonas euroxanthea]|uniref:CHAT domain-containing protein n=1 Tax=Xanthomonas euroxanthea TaxID=2259622 RepID=A0A8E4DVJ0_9XANT|nr:CHAT domain-containing protein [Xanthomonas euroxanthea]CAD1790200.1 CHAT domain-containing protein [Xanthomonas euroxanthea]
MNGFDPVRLFAEGVLSALVVGAKTEEVIGRTGAFGFLNFADPAGQRAFNRVAILAPPIQAWAKSDPELVDLVVDGHRELCGKYPGMAKDPGLAAHVEVVRCQDLTSMALLACLSELTGKLVLIPLAHLYKDADAVVPPDMGRVSALTKEDEWVPHLSSWLTKAVEAISGQPCLMVVSVSEDAPVKSVNKDAIDEIPDLLVAFWGNDKDAQQMTWVAERYTRWSGLAGTGCVDQAIAEIDASELDDQVKRQLRIQALHRAKESLRMAAELRELATGPALPPEFSLCFGSFAQECGEYEIAKAWLAVGVDGAVSEAHLASALGSAVALQDAQLELRIYRRLASLYQQTRYLDVYRERLLLRLSAQVNPGVAREVVAHVDLSEQQRKVADFLNDEGAGDKDRLNALLQDVTEEQRDFALLCLGHRAQALQDPRAAIDCTLGIDQKGPYARQTSWLVVAALRELLLKEAQQDEDGVFFDLPVARLRHYVAHHPEEPALREAFCGLFGVEASGRRGLPVLVAQAVHLSRQELGNVAPMELERPAATPAELEAFLERCFEWMESLGAIDLSKAVLPGHVLKGDAAPLLEALAKMVTVLIDEGQDEDLEAAYRFAMVGSMLARQVQETTLDLDVLRLVASRFSISGKVQRSRDMAEHILEISQNSDVRKRIAWNAYADIYQRSRHPIDALVGLSCAFNLDCDVGPRERWWEIYTLFRVVRDLGLIDFARQLLVPLQTLQVHVDDNASGQARIRAFELGLGLVDPQGRDTASYEQLVADAVDHYRLVQDLDDELLPSAALLGQAIGQCEILGGRVGAEALAALEEAIAGLDDNAKEYVRLISTARPSIDDAIRLSCRVEGARYGDDVPADLLAAEIVARRVLSTKADQLTPSDAAAAIELLADRELDPVDGARLEDAAWPLAFMEQISAPGSAALMMALDRDDALVAVLQDQGRTSLVKREAEKSSFGDVLDDWSARYPWRYGMIDPQDGNNEFFMSMGPLSTPIPQSRRLIVVAEPKLLQVPLNLVPDGDQFLGQSCAIGFIPSLTWLKASRSKPRLKGAKRLAWISDPGDQVDNSALSAVLVRTSNAFEDHGFEVNTDGSVPETLTEASIAVVAAHGSVGADGRFLHRVSDEGTLTLTPRNLSRALAGTELVILFVCSGGRVDRHPHANTAVGLPKQLLVAGSRVVIASPWPISPIFTGRWLEAFMAGWEDGLTAMDATHLANKRVEAQFGIVPQYALAMTTYGDVLMTK